MKRRGYGGETTIKKVCPIRHVLTAASLPNGRFAMFIGRVVSCKH